LAVTDIYAFDSSSMNINSKKCRIASINLAARDISSKGGIINIPGINCGIFPNSRFDSLKLSLPCY